MTKFLASDAVKAVLAHFPDDRFASTSTELQAGFREVATKFPELFGRVSFGRVGAYVSSSTIDAALDSLAVSGFCSRGNLSVGYDLNRDKLLSYYERFLSDRFVDAGISVGTIKEASQALKDALIEICRSPNRERLVVV